MRPGKDLFKRYGGGWAVITGATSGIGKAYAYDLAKQGFNIAMIGRSSEKMSEVATVLESKYNVKTEKILLDLNGPYDELKLKHTQECLKVLDDRDVSILINNAGFGSFGKLGKTDNNSMLQHFNMIYTNTFPLPLITNIILPKIKARERNGIKGAVINVSSVGARGTLIPGLSVYSATKAFDLRFSQVLAKELKADKIDVHCVLPGAVNTNMNKDPQGIFATEADEFSRHSLAQVGNTTESHGHWKHHMFAHYNNWWPTEKVIDYLNAKRTLAFIQKKIDNGEELSQSDQMKYDFIRKALG